MFLYCKQVLKNISMTQGSLHHTFLKRPYGALQNVSTNSQGFIQPGEEKCENSLEKFYFAWNSLILVIFFSSKSEVTVRISDCMSVFSVNSGIYLGSSEVAACPFWTVRVIAHPLKHNLWSLLVSKLESHCQVPSLTSLHLSSTTPPIDFLHIPWTSHILSLIFLTHKTLSTSSHFSHASLPGEPIAYIAIWENFPHQKPRLLRSLPLLNWCPQSSQRLLLTLRALASLLVTYLFTT